MESGPDFDWNPRKEDGDSIAIAHQPAVAVYSNPRGELVIRQEGHYDISEDMFVYVTPAHVPVLALAMLRAVGIVSDRPLRPQIAALVARRESVEPKEAAKAFAALEAELTESEPAPLLAAMSG